MDFLGQPLKTRPNFQSKQVFFGGGVMTSSPIPSANQPSSCLTQNGVLSDVFQAVFAFFAFTPSPKDVIFPTRHHFDD